MKISKRRYEKKLAAVRWTALGEGQERGRQEMADMACDWLGRMREQSTNAVRRDTLLFTQSFAEGQRLLAYAYDETKVEEAIAFQQRFYDSRITSAVIENYPNISQDNYSQLKANYPGALLFFRASDNYAVYNDDANFMMELFGINQPSRLVDWIGKKVPVLHFKNREVAVYIGGVIEAGRKVAITEPGICIETEVLRLIMPINQEAA